jgi:hypothetical protein
MTIEEQNIFWLRFHRLMIRYERLFAPKFNAALKEQHQQYIQNGTLMAVNSIPIHKVLLELYVTIAPLWGKVSNRQIRTYKASGQLGFSQRIIDLIKTYFEVEIWNLADEITSTTKRVIQEVLNQAVKEGSGFDEIVKRLVSPSLTSIRARLIARTEINSAANKAAAIVSRETHLVQDKMWIAAKDNRTRYYHSDHGGVDGTIRPSEEKFNVGGKMMDGPGDKAGGPENVCNCRCVMSFIPRRDSSGRLIRF